MRRIILILAFALIVLSIPAYASEGHEDVIQEGKALVESGVSCDELTDEQLEAIGEYAMEQIHPGEEHEIMDARMGGEGSESLKQAHINIALGSYCGQNYGMGFGMMGQGMMGTGTIDAIGGGTMAYGMMGTGMVGAGFYGLVYLALAAFIFSAIFWLTHNWLVKKKK